MERSRCSVSMRTVTSFLLCAGSYSYFVSNCSSLRRCFLHSLFHSSILLSLFLWLALHLQLSDIILHLASLSASHHLNSYHYEQHPNSPCSPIYTISSKQPHPPIWSSFSLSSLAHFICHLHAFTSPLTFSSIFHPTMSQREQKLILCHSDKILQSVMRSLEKKKNRPCFFWMVKDYYLGILGKVLMGKILLLFL